MRTRWAAPLWAGLLLASCGGGAGTTAAPPPTSLSTTSSTATTEPTTHLAATPAPWTLPAPVSRQAVVVDGDRIVVAGGLGPGSRTTGEVYRLDPGSGQVERRAPLRQPVHDVAGAAPGGHPLAIGGGWHAVGDAVQGLDRAGPTVLGRLPAPRADLAAVTVGGIAYVVGGYDGHQASPSILATTDGRTFRTVGVLPVPVRYPAVAALGRVLYVFGGEAAGGDSDAVQAVDLAAGTARVVGHLPTTVAHASAFTLGGTVWVVGGRVAGRPSPAIRCFRPGTGTVTDAGTLPVGVRDAGVAVIGDAAYLLGGESPAPTAAVVVLRAA